MTILYGLEHQGFTFDLLQHYCIKNKHEDAYLLVNKVQAYNITSLKLDIFFKNVIFFECNYIYGITDRTELIHELNSFFKKILAENKINLDNINTIYVQSDVYDPFAMYLTLNNYNFHILESGINLLNDKYRYEVEYASGHTSREYYCLQKETGVLCGEGHDCIPYGINGFDYINAYKKLNECDKSNILRCFNISSIDISSDSQYLIQNSPGWISVIAKTYFDQSVVYNNVLDFFGNDFTPTIIKPHPGSLDISSFYPNDCVLERIFNIEMLKLFDNKKIKRTISINTTAVDKIEDIVVENIKIGIGFVYHYNLLNRLFFALKLYKSINDDDIFINFIQDSVFVSMLNSKYFVNYGGKLHNDSTMGSQILTDKYVDCNGGLDQIILDVCSHSMCESYKYSVNFTILSFNQKNKKTSSEEHITYLTNDFNKFNHACLFTDYKFCKHSFEIRYIKSSQSKKDMLHDEKLENAYISWALEISKDKHWTKDYISILLDNQYIQNEKVTNIYKNRAITADCAYVIMFILIEEGLIEEKSEENKLDWLRLATDIDSNWIATLCPKLLKSDNPNNHVEAYNRCLSASKNNPEAMGLLGRMYFSGKGVKKDYNLAIHWLELASLSNPLWTHELENTKYIIQKKSNNN